MTDTRARNNRGFFKIDPELARDLLMNISKLIDDVEIDDYGNVASIDTISTDGSIKLVSSKTIFAMLNIPVGTKLEPIIDKYTRVITISDINLVRIESGEEKAIYRVAVDATGHSEMASCVIDIMVKSCRISESGLIRTIYRAISVVNYFFGYSQLFLIYTLF